MNFSKTTSYSIKILLFMSENGEEMFSAKSLYQNLKIPYQYLRTLLTKLSKSGFIVPTQGRSGGFSIVKKPDEIFLAEIIDSIEGLESLDSCLIGIHPCPFDNKCQLHEFWAQQRLQIIEKLKTTSLLDLQTKI